MRNLDLNRIIDIIAKAKDNGIQMLLSEGTLKLKIDKRQNPDPAIIEEIKQWKQELLDFLEQEQAGKTSGDESIVRFDRSEILRIPLSYSQERLWFVDLLKGSVQYHTPAILRMKGSLDRRALESSLRQIVNRHEVLRTVIHEQDGQPYQVLLGENGWHLAICDHPSFRDNDPALQSYIERLIAAPFDLSADYMLRAELIPLAVAEHLLVVTLHHISSDGFSIPVILRELGELYTAAVEEREPKLSPLLLQYSDYSVWQRRRLEGPLMGKLLQYWTQKLDGVSTLDLPLDYIRPLVQTWRGGVSGFAVDPELARQLQQLSAREGVTLFMTLLAAFKVLLHRYSGQEDICVGTSVAGRNQKETEGMAGFFVNTLAIRSQVLRGMDFRSLLQQIKETTVEAYEYQDAPFEKVVEATVTERDPGRNPLVQALFVMQNISPSDNIQTLLRDLELSWEPVRLATTKFDLTFFVESRIDGLWINIEYCRDLFAGPTIHRMGRLYLELLRDVVANPAKIIGKLSLLPVEERDMLLRVFNSNRIKYDGSITVMGMLEMQAKRNPEAGALAGRGKRLTYRELDIRTNQIGHYLRRLGVRENNVVPVLVDGSVSSVVGILGILKAGGAYAPISGNMAAERMRFMLKDTGCPFVVGSRGIWERLEGLMEMQLVDVEEEELLKEEPGDAVARATGPGDLAYVIYTSGSTGRPKGVMIEHRSLVDYVYGLAEGLPAIRDCRRFGLVSTLAADLGNTMLYCSLFLGGELHVLSEEGITDEDYLHRYLREEGIDCLKLVPSHWKALSVKAPLLPGKLVIFGGEVLPVSLVARIAESGSSCHVANHYGPTETTIGKLVHLIGNEVGLRVPIGKPFGSTVVRILSAGGDLCPIGMKGEICIGGDGLARGYWRQPELTSEKFVADVYRGDPGARLYRTGDLGRWTESGEIEYLGRIDDQVKISGYRVEPAEVAIALGQYRGVRQAVVLGMPGIGGETKLVGYIAATEDIDKARLEDWLRERLPAYMIPRQWVQLEALPLTANGKVDRRALPLPGSAEAAITGYAGARNLREERLIAIWERLLEVERVGVHDNFFELGGHSLLAIRVVSAVRGELKIDIGIGDVFDFPTIAALATELSGRERGGHDPKDRSTGASRAGTLVFCPGAAVVHRRTGGQCSISYSGSVAIERRSEHRSAGDGVARYREQA
jgi:amino acid adenylation domain-containing protein